MSRVRVDASRLTQLILLAAPPTTAVPDGQGGFIEDPQPLSPPTDYAAITDATSASDELPVAGTVVQSLSHLVQLRYRPDVDLHTQITFVDWGARTHRLYVRALGNPQQQSELLHLWCEEQR